MHIEGKEGLWEYVIGLEIHAQIDSKSKLFSSSEANFGDEPNSNASIIDAAFPGTLPVLNAFCVAQGIKTALGLNAKISLFSAFDRKSYFYPDLPSGYQISQFYHPIARNGWLAIEDGTKVEIERIHLEQDAGKSIHDLLPEFTCIDLNRAGVPLMEIVSTPCIRSPNHAASYLKQLRSLLRCLGTCTGDMEKGALRCDANVSVRRKGDEALGQRCEIKNLNSIKHVVKALEFEGQRQVGLLEKGVALFYETRGFDAESGSTYLMRSKEQSRDYRYFPDPDLPPIVLTQEYIDQVAREMPEVPEAKIARYIQDLGLSQVEAAILVSSKEVSDYFELSVGFGADAKRAANWLISVLFALLKEFETEISNSKFSPKHLAELVSLIEAGKLSSSAAKLVCKELFENGGDLMQVVETLNLLQITNLEEVARIVDLALQHEQETVAAYVSGKHKVFGSLVAAVLKYSGGRANPSVVQSILKAKLEKLSLLQGG